jgi:hypothetical protein
LLGDLNTNLLQNSRQSDNLRQKLNSICLTIVPTEPKHFSAKVPTLLDIFATGDPTSIKFFTQLALPGMNTDHDLIYGAYKMTEITKRDAS